MQERKKDWNTKIGLKNEWIGNNMIEKLEKNEWRNNFVLHQFYYKEVRWMLIDWKWWKDAKCYEKQFSFSEKLRRIDRTWLSCMIWMWKNRKINVSFSKQKNVMFWFIGEITREKMQNEYKNNVLLRAAASLAIRFRSRRKG